MSKMIEQVERAMILKMAEPGSTDRDVARAAIQAMRGPNESALFDRCKAFVFEQSQGERQNWHRRLHPRVRSHEACWWASYRIRAYRR